MRDMGTLKSRVKRLEDASTGGSFEACLRYAREWAELLAYDETPWTAEQIQEHARRVMEQGGPWTHEQLLAELEQEG